MTDTENNVPADTKPKMTAGIVPSGVDASTYVADMQTSLQERLENVKDETEKWRAELENCEYQIALWNERRDNAKKTLLEFRKMRDFITQMLDL